MVEIGLKLVSWWATAWLHGVLLLAAVYLAERAGVLRSASMREAAWRLALLAPLLTASLQGICIDQPWAGRRVVDVGQVAAAGVIEAGQPSWGGSGATDAAERPGVTYAGPGMRSLPGPPATGHPGESAVFGATGLAVIGWSWTLLGGLLIARLLWRWRRELHRVRALPIVSLDVVVDDAGALVRSAGLDSISLRQDCALASPVAVARTTVCVPPWALQQLRPLQRRAMLAHELAHLMRCDPHWRVALAASACVLPLPMAATARRRLDHLAEHACDAWAARQTGAGRALAEALAACAEYGLSGRQVSAFAAAMAPPRSALVERVQRLIEDKPMQFDRISTLRRTLLGSALLIGIAVLPGLTIVDSAIAGIVVNEKDQPPPAPPAPPAPPEPAQPPAPPPPPPPPTDPVPPPAPPTPPAPPAPPSEHDDALVQGGSQGAEPAPPQDGPESSQGASPFRELQPGVQQLFVLPFSSIEPAGDGC